MNTKQQAGERIRKLRSEINRHRYLYHVLDQQEISDAALDALKHELALLEEQFPEFLTPDSPSQRVAGKPLAKFRKVAHRVRMTSLADAFSADELRAWEARVRKIIPREHFSYFAEAKGDGFAVSLTYRKGIFAVGATRGDGMVGEDVTENLKTIEAIPLALAAPDEMRREALSRKILDAFPRVRKAVERIPREIEVRGEVYMTKQAFARANREQERKGLPAFANPRNIAAGSVRQLDPAITRARMLSFFAWDLVTDCGQETHEEEHLIMHVLGFPTVPLAERCDSLNGVVAFYEAVGKKRESLPFLIDGVVVQVNEGRFFERLGIVGKAPRGAVAFKFPAKEATTVIEDIIVQVGRTGILTPVAVLRPVPIGGVLVSRATLHNQDEIERLGVKIGDTVIVERAGDVIPAVTGVLRRLRPRNARAFRMPAKCPICASPVVRRGEGNEAPRRPSTLLRAGGSGQGVSVGYYCSNVHCAAIQRRSIYHFVSKHALDIEGLGPKNVDALLENGLIRDAADLFALQRDNIAELQRFGEKSAENLIAAIAAKKDIPLARFLYALGIPQVGEETAMDLARRFGSLESIRAASLEELSQVRDIGSVVAQSIRAWFGAERNQKFLARLARVGVRAVRERVPRRAGTLAGKTFVLTGGLESMTRGEAKARIRERGGEISESVSRKTDYVIVGSDPGSKFDRAQKLGVATVDEKEFLKLLK
ncbi:MAG: hypothetical protein A3A44_00195 [Candidatus Sungbacteria bacterium RIFCSPLOWO2_01_FULL_60_25]|uniref:DNA ligase n=1 Tax=Candidatus Sungbacteria bacterium RIFCSPLOWO2_01_FULL_60_25 TaxID=1802281 RepID=A0A1G2LC77_9BACT|nr:MAG: hypothetical protein A3A44_00195 [Candidatus Sungbacteria bacterium RIFCSPLOWO2_01_FULL_60_25]